MTSPRLMQKRRFDIKSRISSPPHALPQCAVLDCGRPTMAKKREGLNRNYCRAHVEHFRRHGSYAKSSYKAAQLAPYRARALTWLGEHACDPAVREAVERVRTLYRRGGRPEAAFRLAGKSPERRALNCWARLGLQGVDPLHALAAWISVSLCHQADLQPERKIEFQWVQAGKILHRMSGGSHKRWEHAHPLGGTTTTELHKYPASRGRVLRHLGEQLALAAKPLEGHLGAIEGSERSATRLPRAKARVSR
jgi:hypothetical protein